MGIYIQTGTHKNKVQWLLDNFEGAHEVPTLQKFDNSGDPPKEVDVLVVDNGFFEAAGIIYNASERRACLSVLAGKRPWHIIRVPRQQILEKHESIFKPVEWDLLAKKWGLRVNN